MAEVAVPSLVLFVVGLLIAGAVASVFATEVEGLSEEIDQLGVDTSDRVGANIELFTDTQSPLYNVDGNDSIRLYVRNSGVRTLPTDTDQIDVYLDGAFVEGANLSVTVLDGAEWGPGGVIELKIAAPCIAAGDHRVKIDVRGHAETTAFTTPAGTGCSAWNFRKPITIDHTQVAADLTDYPVLVSITDSDLAADAQDDGDDIKFTDDSGTQLDHEIESFDGSTGELVAWVRVPTLSSSTDTTIYMYYGNSSAENQENVAGVWDSNYVGVWHLDEAGATTDRIDSTSFDNDASPQSLDGDESTTGKIGDGIHVDGTDDHLSAADSASLEMSDVDDVTVEAWVNKDTAQSGWIAMVQKSDQSYNLQFDGGDNPEFTIYDGGWRTADSGMTVNTGEWYHLVGTFDGSTGTIRMYVNGVEVGTGSASHISDASGWDVGIGENLDSTGRHLDGRMDEVRISDTPRSAAWIETTYNNTDDPSSFYTVGPEEAN